MTEERYHAVQAWFRARPAALKALLLGNKLLSAAVYIGYIGMILVLLLHRDGRLWRVLIVPAVVFLGGSALRRYLNFPRPYEVYHTPSLDNKNRSGQSFPSRHMFSASVLAVCAFWLWSPMGWVMAGIAVFLAPFRVLVGVHFIRDVAAGALLGSVLGYLGFFVL